jgi:N-alpha-acetyltransferase 38, NatC auxiliary subunit
MFRAALLSNGFIINGAGGNKSHHFLMRDTQAIQNLKSILRTTLRIITDDDRAFVGTFVGTDKDLNILLVNTEEFRLGASEGPAGRFVGQVMIPWRLIQNIGLQVAGESNAGGYAEQVHLSVALCRASLS